MKEYYNLQKVIKIKVKDKSVNSWFKFKKEIKVLGICIRKKGFWSNGIGNYRVKRKSLLDSFIIQDNKVYYKPYIRIYFSDEISKDIEYNSYKDAKSGVNDFIKKHKLSQVVEIKE